METKEAVELVSVTKTEFSDFSKKVMDEIGRVKHIIQKRSFFDGIGDDCAFYANLDVSKTLIICFSGFKQNVAGVQPFEFFNLFSDCNAQSLFLKDPSKTWFLSGIPAFGKNVESIANNIVKIIKEFGIERVITVGGSAGGFASILFGSLIGADVVISLMPQTFVDPKQRENHNIKVYAENVRNLYRNSPDQAELYGDVRNAILNSRDKTEYHIFYPDIPDDVVFAEHLKGAGNLRLYKAKYQQHSLGQYMKKSNVLKPLMMSAIYKLDVYNTVSDSFGDFFEVIK